MGSTTEDDYDRAQDRLLPFSQRRIYQRGYCVARRIIGDIADAVERCSEADQRCLKDQQRALHKENWLGRMNQGASHCLLRSSNTKSYSTLTVSARANRLLKLCIVAQQAKDRLPHCARRTIR